MGQINPQNTNSVALKLSQLVQYQVFIHIHVLWLDEAQLDSGFPHDTDGPVFT